MFGRPIRVRARNGGEGESPFWISYSDMMTALMVLFLVVMAVALLSIPKEVIQAHTQTLDHQQDIADFMTDLYLDTAREFPEVRIDVEKHVIDFGEIAYFGNDEWLLKPAQQASLRAYMPHLLGYLNSPTGKRLIESVLVEGYTSRSGSYLHNLNLSLKRSEGVVCALLAERGENLLDAAQKEQVLGRFVVGGYSFNKARPSEDESRRVELQLQFYALGTKPKQHRLDEYVIGACEV